MGSNKDFSVAIVIPARFKSSRFPGKPLAFISGKQMILRVCETARLVLPVEKIFVATDDESIAEVVLSNGYRVIMTSDNCLTGTDRVAEASKEIDADIIINIQGDEPILDPKDIERVINAKRKKFNYVINAYTYLSNLEDPLDINIPKVALNEKSELIYISRASIPAAKDKLIERENYMKQVCIYAFNKRELEAFNNFTKKGYVENLEDIEILRFFELGIKIYMVETHGKSIAVDTPEDILKVERAINGIN